MKCIFGIEKIVSGGTDQVAEFHHVMFHGVAERPGAQKYTPEEYGVGRGATLPLSIARPGNFFPPVCMPQSNLVVNSDIAAALRKIENIRLLPVTFASLFEIRYAKGDMWWYEHGQHQDPTEFARKAPNKRHKFDPVPDYFEVIAVRYQDVQVNLDKCHRFRLTPVRSDLAEDADFRASDSLFDQCPVIWNGFTIIAENVFRILEPHLDRDFFSVSEAQQV